MSAARPPSLCTLALAALFACGDEKYRLPSDVDLALCWGAGPDSCENVLDSPAPSDDATSACGEAPLAPIARVPRVGDQLPLSVRFAAPTLDSPATLTLTASGSLRLIEADQSVDRVEISVPPRGDTIVLRSVEAIGFGPGRVELSGAGQGAALTANIAAPLAIGIQPPLFRRLQKLATQIDIGVCSSLPEGPFQLDALPGGLAALASRFGPATRGACPEGYRGYASVLWTGPEPSFDLSVTQREQTLRCSVAVPGAIGAVNVALAAVPEWISVGARLGSTIQVRVTGIAADQSEAPLAGVAVVVTGPEEASIRGANPTDVDGVFSFLLDAPPGGPLQLNLLVEDRFRRLLRVERPGTSTDAGAP